MKKVRWGILGTAKIAREWVIPALQNSDYAEVVAVASRDLGKAQQFANENSITQAFGSYEALLACDDVDAVYNPMPNHQHVPWSIAAVEAGKHVLCEKPLGLDSADIQKLVDVTKRHPEVVVMEAFMYRFHPQWLKITDLISAGALGDIKQVQASFTYFNRDPENVRNKPGIGGGGLLDIGCYCISAARLAFAKEPERVSGVVDIDPDFEVDVHCAAVLDFGCGMATINCSTQANPSQFMQIVGEKGRLVIDTPFFKREDKPCELVFYSEHDKQVIPIGHYNHYEYQVDAVSQAILNGSGAPTPLADAVNNMKVIDAIFASSESNTWTAV